MSCQLAAGVVLAATGAAAFSPWHVCAAGVRARQLPRRERTGMAPLSLSVRVRGGGVDGGGDGRNEDALASLGIISDIQYADVDDGASHGGTPRYYRHAREATRTAVAAWCKHPRVNLAIHCGDILDGKQPRAAASDALRDIQRCFEPFAAAKGGGPDGLSGRVLHVVGNHCLYNLDRATLISTLGMEAEAPLEEEEGCLYYTVSPAPGVRLIVLDGYDISFAWPPGTARGDKARAMLAEARGVMAGDNVNSPARLAGLSKRWVAFNGAVGPQQELILKSICLISLVSV